VHFIVRVVRASAPRSWRVSVVSATPHAQGAPLVSGGTFRNARPGGIIVYSGPIVITGCLWCKGNRVTPSSAGWSGSRATASSTLRASWTAGYDRLIDELSYSFEGVFPRTLLAQAVADAHAALEPTATVTAYLPVLVDRFACTRLTAAAQADGRMAKTVPEVLFVCVHNAGRSQVAAAFLAHPYHRGHRSPLSRMTAS